MKLLRLFLRYAPSERQRVFILTIVIGVLCGFAAVAFHLSIKFAEGQLIDRAMTTSGGSWIAWTIITPTLGGILCGVLLAFIVPDARGSGIPQVKVAYSVRGGRMPFKVAVGKFVIGVLQIGSGASLGREGPTVQICAGIASALGRMMAIGRRNRRMLLPVGAAAGIAAAFNAPLAAVTFTIEEIVGDLDQTVLSGVIVAAALASVIERYVLGEHPVFTVPAGYGLHYSSSLLLYTLLGLVAAVVSIAFSDSLLRLRGWFNTMRGVPVWARPGIGGLVTGLLAVAALAWLNTGGVTGGGYETLSRALGGELPMRVLLALGTMKIVATVFSYSSGGAGGIFAPSLFIGGMVGGAIGFLDVRLLGHPTGEIGAFALVGMGAVFAGIVRAPITSVLIIFEMTGSYGLILPLMIANMAAYAIARHWRPKSVYEALLEQDGVHLPHGGGRGAHALERIMVGEAMTADPVSLPAGISAGEGLRRIAGCDYASFPVIDADGIFLGIVGEAKLRRTCAEGEEGRPVEELAGQAPTITPDEPLVNAVLLMNQYRSGRVAVIDPGDSNHLLGLLTMADIVRAHARAVGEAGGGDAP
jgi:CIC family chloride channel protein